MYKPVPVREVTTEDLIVTIARDRNDVACFEARAAFVGRTRSDWRTFAPSTPRSFVEVDGERIYWHNFHETGLI